MSIAWFTLAIIKSGIGIVLAAHGNAVAFVWLFAGTMAAAFAGTDWHFNILHRNVLDAQRRYMLSGDERDRRRWQRAIDAQLKAFLGKS